MIQLILVRGLPGSGKSTIANRLARDSGFVHLEADMFFVKDGVYKWNPDQIGEAHEWCQNDTRYNLMSGRSVVVSNTFTRKKELQPYFKIAKDLGIIPGVILTNNVFKNIHNVPQVTLDKMKQRFEYDISSLFDQYTW